jgi:hypothetical protein
MFMAGEHRDAISRVDDLIATVSFNSICYIVQARTHVLPCSEYQLIFPAVIYVSSPWKLAHGAQRLRGCNTIVRACTSPNATRWGPTALGGLVGKLPNGCIATYRNRSPTVRYLDGNLIISTSRLDSVYVKLCTQRIARRMQANPFSSW